ncbi:MAG TPA: hypothetical protein VGX69_12075 [Solirubrobacteraceae bacterium]|jgi:hypothetical protein|nr:hypothetical protein [Solirubrobacteraceae bacterium]
MSEGVRRRIESFITRQITTVGLHRESVFLIVTVVIGVLAALLAPSVHSRTAADGLRDVFIGFLAVLVTALAVPLVSSWMRDRMQAIERAMLVLGCGGAAAGLFNLPLVAYRYVFAAAAAVAALAHELLTVIFFGQGRRAR